VAGQADPIMGEWDGRGLGDGADAVYGDVCEETEGDHSPNIDGPRHHNRQSCRITCTLHWLLCYVEGPVEVVEERLFLSFLLGVVRVELIGPEHNYIGFNAAGADSHP
jgi:hypothetical protein